MENINVPTPEGKEVQKLISIIGIKTKPEYIDIKPASFAQVNECFPAVKEKINRNGGSRIIGWQIWKSDILVEAEFHAVWKSDDGKIIDITPKSIPVTKILFLSDSRRKYTGSQVDNIRVNITKNRLVNEFIEIAKAEFELMNKGDRALTYEVALSNQESQVYMKIKEIQQGVYEMIRRGETRNSACFCGSQNKYKRCCGKMLAKLI